MTSDLLEENADLRKQQRWLRLYNTNTVNGIITDTEKFLSEE